MKKILIQEDKQLVEERLRKFEANTGCELLLVVANSSDPYPGASWRFGVLSGFILSLIFSYFYEFHHAYLWPLFFLIVTLFMTWIGHFEWAKRLALSDWEVARETEEKAFEYFHSLGTSQVSHKVTAMIMVSLLEKKIIVMVDKELKTKLTQKDLDHEIHLMQEHFKKGDMPSGFIQSIGSLESKIIGTFGGKVSAISPSELRDTIIFI